MTGRVFIVTGASSGLGYEVARYLCEGGNDVILACRSEEKTNRAIEKIKRANPNALATFMELDLASLESINKFVETFHASEKKLHGLINNAGVACNPKDLKRQYTTENFELTMGTNHLGPFLLTNLLLEDLKKAGADGGDARVVNVTASIHDPESVKRKNNLVALDLDNLFLFNENTYNGLQAYKNSKLANVMFTYELARRLEGTGVTANCVCPGFVPGTELQRNSSKVQKMFDRYVLQGMLRFAKITRSVQQGGAAICTLATDDKYKEVSGKFFKDGAEAKSSEESLDEDKQKRLWELSGGFTKLEGFEPVVVERPPEPEPEPAKKEEPAEDAASPAEEAKPEEGEAKPEDNKTDNEKGEEKEGVEKEKEVEEKKEDVKEKKKKKKQKAASATLR